MGSGFRVMTYLNYPACHCWICSSELIILPRKKRIIGILSKRNKEPVRSHQQSMGTWW